MGVKVWISLVLYQVRGLERMALLKVTFCRTSISMIGIGHAQKNHPSKWSPRSYSAS